MNYLNQHWKTIAALVYMAITVFDFIIIPIFMSYNFTSHSEYIHSWMPFTLRGAGLFHLSFGAILTGHVLGSRGD